MCFVNAVWQMLLLVPPLLHVLRTLNIAGGTCCFVVLVVYNDHDVDVYIDNSEHHNYHDYEWERLSIPPQPTVISLLVNPFPPPYR